MLDNAAIHDGKEKTVLGEWLWTNFEIYVLFLPPRSPELNPIELVWGILVQRLRVVPLDELRKIGAHSSAIKSKHILAEITHRDVEGCFLNVKFSLFLLCIVKMILIPCQCSIDTISI